MKKKPVSRLRALRLIGLLCLLAGLMLLAVACDKGDDANTTEAEITSAEEPTATPTEASTAPVTDPVTEVPTEVDTVPVTEPETTEAETLPVDAPTVGAVLTFCDTPLNATILDPNSATAYEIVTDEVQGSVLKLTTVESDRLRDPYIKIDYAAYMELAGVDPVAWNDCGYAVFLVKLEGITNSKLEMAVYNKSGEKSKTVRGSATYKTSEADWQYVLMPLVDAEYEGALSEIRLDFVDQPETAGQSVYVRSITFVKDKLDALSLMGTSLLTVGEATIEIPGLQNEYTFLHVTDLHSSAVSDEDQAGMDASRYNYLIARRAAFAADGLYAEERMPLFFDYADEIGADLLLLTGDLLDFPTEKNISMLYSCVQNAKTRSLFCLGNHDWTYADDYFSAYAVATYIPRFAAISGSDNEDAYFSYVEYDDLIVAAIDNSTDVVTQATLDKFFALYEKGKPIILMLHVPLHAETLEADVRNAWGGRNITMGIGALGNDWSSVRELYTSVCLDEDTPVVAVIAGHVHFNHEDVFPNGVPQYITSTAYTGDCRVITVKGTD